MEDRHFSMLLGNGVAKESLSVESNGAGREVLHKLPGGRLRKEACPPLINFPHCTIPIWASNLVSG